MEDRERLTTNLRANLVAYLDGELDEDATRQIEQVLSRSAEARHEVDALSSTWELLDVLPRPMASEGFTERTMTTIKLGVLSGGWRRQPWFQRLQRGVILAAWLIGLSGAAAIGFQAANRWVPNDADLLLDDLPVIQDLDIYQEIGSIEFVKALKNEGLFDEVDDAGKSTSK